MNRLTVEQLERNADSRDNWDAGAAHRQRVMQLITQGFELKNARLCVLGAGNCNDLDLVQLAETFAETHLVDLDEAALKSAAERQSASERMGVDNKASIELHTPMDVTGVWTQLSQWAPQHPAEDSIIDRVIEEAYSFVQLDGPSTSLHGPSASLHGPSTSLHGPSTSLHGPFDMVVSTCLISQLIEGVVNTLGERHPRFLDVLTAVRDSHLRLMTALTAPGGYGILVTDFVSAVTAPELRTMTDQELPEALARLIVAGNFFHGVNPDTLLGRFRNDPIVAPRVERSALIRPWRWTLEPRVFGVTAIKYRRTP